MTIDPLAQGRRAAGAVPPSRAAAAPRPEPVPWSVLIAGLMGAAAMIYLVRAFMFSVSGFPGDAPLLWLRAVVLAVAVVAPLFVAYLTGRRRWLGVTVLAFPFFLYAASTTLAL